MITAYFSTERSQVLLAEWNLNDRFSLINIFWLFQCITIFYTAEKAAYDRTKIGLFYL